jgi:NNP family nitrate/nitrite transporter-like MFS transporter
MFSLRMYASLGMRGRFYWQSLVLLFEGALVIIFSHAQSLSASIGILVLFSMFVQAAEGSTYG